jgi:hypothetical protein
MNTNCYLLLEPKMIIIVFQIVLIMVPVKIDVFVLETILVLIVKLVCDDVIV